jgi:hypothetical protein
MHNGELIQRNGEVIGYLWGEPPAHSSMDW